MIANDILDEAKMGHACLVLVERKLMGERLLDRVADAVPSGALYGHLSNSRRKEVLRRVRVGSQRVLFASSQLLGEGFDHGPISRLFLPLPSSSPAKLVQYIGRIARRAEGKTSAIVYDYVDSGSEMLARMADKRRTIYRQAGVTSTTGGPPLEQLAFPEDAFVQST